MYGKELPHACEQMLDALNDPRIPVVYDEIFREYGITDCEESSIMQVISYCPWCGTPLPSSLRDAWFDRLDKLGLDPGDERIPKDMATSAWWRTSDL
jgi:hypothetical protein